MNDYEKCCKLIAYLDDLGCDELVGLCKSIIKNYPEIIPFILNQYEGDLYNIN